MLKNSCTFPVHGVTFHLRTIPQQRAALHNKGTTQSAAAKDLRKGSSILRPTFLNSADCVISLSTGCCQCVRLNVILQLCLENGISIMTSCLMI